MDIGALVSLVGRDWVERYLRENELGWEKMKTYECNQAFKFGPSKKCVCKVKMEVPLVVKTLEGGTEVLWVVAYIVDADVPFLVGKSMLEKWGSKLNTVDRILEMDKER